MAKSGSRKMSVAWWCVIAISIALKITTPWQAWVPEEDAGSDGDRLMLVIMEMQGRFLIGMAQTQPKGLERQLAEMEILATTDRTAVAVAAIRFFIDPEGNGKWRALALVKARLRNSPEESVGQPNRQLLENVRTVLEKPGQISDEDSQEIRTEMGWFGDVLLAANAAEGSPEAETAKSIRKQYLIVLAMTSFMGLAVMGIGLLGLVLLTMALLNFRAGKLHLAGVCEEIPAQPYLGAFALYLSLMVLADFLSVVLAEFYNISIHPAIGIAAMFASVGIAFYWPRLRGLAWRETLRGFGWRRGKGVLREMRAGVIGYVAVTPLIALGLSGSLVLIMISGWLAGNGGEPADTNSSPVPISHPVLLWLADGDWKIKLAVILSASGLAPLFEETMFRGALYGVFRKRWGFVVSGLATGVIFASVHPQGLLAIPALTSAGFGFALIREWRGSLISSMTAHALHNGILVGTIIIALS